MTDSWIKNIFPLKTPHKEKKNSTTKEIQSSYFLKKDLENCNKWFLTKKNSEFHSHHELI